MPVSDPIKDIKYMHERLKAQGLGSRDPVIILRGNDAINYERLVNQEMNRLRSEVDRLDDALDGYIVEVAETRTENDSLTSTLSKIMDIMCYPGCWDTACYDTIESAISEVFECSNECCPKLKEVGDE